MLPGHLLLSIELHDKSQFKPENLCSVKICSQLSVRSSGEWRGQLEIVKAVAGREDLTTEV